MVPARAPAPSPSHARACIALVLCLARPPTKSPPCGSRAEHVWGWKMTPPSQIRVALGWSLWGDGTEAKHKPSSSRSRWHHAVPALAESWGAAVRAARRVSICLQREQGAGHPAEPEWERHPKFYIVLFPLLPGGPVPGFLLPPSFGQSVTRSFVPDRGHCREAGAVPAEESGRLALRVLGGERFPSQAAALLGNPPAFALVSLRDVTTPGCPKCTSWPAGTQGGRNRSCSTDGMAWEKPDQGKMN